MKKINKPLWLDTILSLLGLIISIVSVFNIIGFVTNLSTINFINYLNLLLGLFIIVIIQLKRRNSTQFTKIKSSNISSFISKIDKSYNNIIIQNPDIEINKFNEIIDYFIQNRLKISVIGEANHLESIFDILAKKQIFSKNFNVNSSSHLDYMSLFLYNDNKKRLLILLFGEDKDALFLNIRNSNLSFELIRIIENEDLHNLNSINLNSISKPKNFLKIINKEKQKYITNFANLKSGYISFYGTEVLNVQSGWLEEGNYKLIQTLDLTIDPSILLTRHRYNKANQEFIAKGGIIKRVYLVPKSRLEKDVFFKENLINAVNLQRKIGVTIGLQFIDDLEPDEKQDFILYDNFAVLIEEKQANSDYTFGKSTAYFEKGKIKLYNNLFNKVWEGKSLKYNSIEQLNKLNI